MLHSGMIPAAGILWQSEKKRKDDAIRRFNVEKIEVILSWASASLGLSAIWPSDQTLSEGSCREWHTFTVEMYTQTRMGRSNRHLGEHLGSLQDCGIMVTSPMNLLDEQRLLRQQAAAQDLQPQSSRRKSRKTRKCPSMLTRDKWKDKVHM